MVVWTIAACCVMLLIVLIPGLHDALQFARMDIAYLSGHEGMIARGAGWAVALAFPVFMLLCLEGKKWLMMGCACADDTAQSEAASKLASEQDLFPAVATKAALPALPTAATPLPLSPAAPAKTVTFHLALGDQL